MPDPNNAKLRDYGDGMRDDVLGATLFRYEKVLSKQIEERKVIPVVMNIAIWDGIVPGDIYYTQPIQALVFCRIGWARWIKSQEELDRLIKEDGEKEEARTRVYPRSGVCEKLRRAVLCK